MKASNLHFDFDQEIFDVLCVVMFQIRTLLAVDLEPYYTLY